MCKYIDDSMQTFPRIAHSLAKQRPKRHELAVANHYSVHAFFLWRNHVREKSLSASPSLLSPRKASRHIPSLLARTKGASCSAPSSRVPGHSLCVNMHESYPDGKLWGNAYKRKALYRPHWSDRWNVKLSKKRVMIDNKSDRLTDW